MEKTFVMSDKINFLSGSVFSLIKVVKNECWVVELFDPTCHSHPIELRPFLGRFRQFCGQDRVPDVGT